MNTNTDRDSPAARVITPWAADGSLGEKALDKLREFGIFGRRVADAEVDGTSLRSERRLKLARQAWLEIAWDDLEVRDGFWVDEPSGRLYLRRLDDPLLSGEVGGMIIETADELRVDAFTQGPSGALTFLERPKRGPKTVAELEQAQVERTAVAEREERERVAWLAGQPQVPVLADAPMTLRDAARLLEHARCQVQVGRFGELAITRPEMLTRTPNAERGERERVRQAAELLARAERVVLAALQGLNGGCLSDALPDAPVTVGGGAG